MDTEHSKGGFLLQLRGLRPLRPFWAKKRLVLVNHSYSFVKGSRLSHLSPFLDSIRFNLN